MAGFAALAKFTLLQGRTPSVASITAMLGGDTNDAVINVMVLSVVAQLFLILFNLISAVVITKAFLLAEVRLALKGQPTEWGKRAFNIAASSRDVVYR